MRWQCRRTHARVATFFFPFIRNDKATNSTGASLISNEATNTTSKRTTFPRLCSRHSCLICLYLYALVSLIAVAFSQCLHWPPLRQTDTIYRPNTLTLAPTFHKQRMNGQTVLLVSQQSALSCPTLACVKDARSRLVEARGSMQPSARLAACTFLRPFSSLV
jgi:hypothetical protein